MGQENIIPILVDRVREGKIQRRHLIKTLAALGISAGGVNAIVASTTRPGAAQPAAATSNADAAQQHIQLHEQHITNQGQGNFAALANDYADNAIVEDPMVPVPVVGRAAIIARKTSNSSAITDGQITVLQRIAQGNQVMVEWEATGLHTGDLPGLPATNRPYTVRGVTVVVRENGKIVRESLYYDLADLQQQLK